MNLSNNKYKAISQSSIKIIIKILYHYLYFEKTELTIIYEHYHEDAHGDEEYYENHSHARRDDQRPLPAIQLTFSIAKIQYTSA